jgi:hypothetical protein
MPLDRNERIRQRAYEIWEREGRPHGRDEEHWRMAAEEIGGDSGTSVTQAVPATRVSGTAKPGGESSVEAQPSKPTEAARPAPQADPLGLAQPGNNNPARRGTKPRGGAPRKTGSPAPGGPGRPH